MHLTGNAYLIFLSSTCQDKSKAESLEKGIPTTDSKPPGDLMSKKRQKEKKIEFCKTKTTFYITHVYKEGFKEILFSNQIFFGLQNFFYCWLGPVISCC